MSVLRDITDRVASEEALRRSEARYRALIEKTNEAISLTRADGTTTYLTPGAAARLLGLTVDELATRTPRDQVIPEDRVRIADELDRLASSADRDSTLEFRIRRPDGSLRWIESSATNLLEDPDVAAIVGNYRDITARKSADEARQESRDLLEEAQAVAHVGSWSSDLGSDNQLTWSRECFRIFGLPEDAPVSGEVFFACVHPEDREAAGIAARRISTNTGPMRSSANRWTS